MNEINELAGLIIDAHLKGNKVLACGNGGLCAESEHFSAELVGKYAFDEYVPCISLTSNTFILTAIANDLGYAEVFAHPTSLSPPPLTSHRVRRRYVLSDSFLDSQAQPPIPTSLSPQYPQNIERG